MSLRTRPVKLRLDPLDKDPERLHLIVSSLPVTNLLERNVMWSLTCWWQVRSESLAGGLCWVSDAFPADGSGEQVAASVREGATTSGAAGRGRSLHAPLQQDRASHTKDEHHHVCRELQRQHQHADAGTWRFEPCSVQIRAVNGHNSIMVTLKGSHVTVRQYKCNWM